MPNANEGPILNRYAVKGGIIAPPTMDMIINDEANFEPSPKSLHANAKIVGNIMDWKKYTIINAITAKIPPPNIAMTMEITEPTA